MFSIVENLGGKQVETIHKIKIDYSSKAGEG
jgi:hypothetical protein